MCASDTARLDADITTKMRKLAFTLACCMLYSTAHAAPANTKLISQVKESVTRKLKDPESVRFRSVFAMRGSVCGEVNAKNSYGGYVGFKRFLAIEGLLVMLDDDGMAFAQMYDETCSKTPPKPRQPPPYFEESWKDLPAPTVEPSK